MGRARVVQKRYIRETFLISVELKEKIKGIYRELERQGANIPMSHFVEMLIREELKMEKLEFTSTAIDSQQLRAIALQIPDNNNLKHEQIQFVLDKTTSRRLDEVSKGLAGDEKKQQKNMLVEIVLRSKLGMPFYEHPVVTRIMDLQEKIEAFIGVKTENGKYVCEA